MEVFKPNDIPLVSLDLGAINDVTVAAVKVREEIVRVIRRDNELHLIAKSSHLRWKIIPYLDDNKKENIIQKLFEVVEKFTEKVTKLEHINLQNNK